MSITNFNHRKLQFLTIIILVLVLAGCNRVVTNVATATINPLPGMSQPIRVSSEDADAAEPAIAASPDGGGYVVWVNHGLNAQADVMIARFAEDGRMQSPAVRVNLQPGIATAWRGDPPTVAVAPDQTVFVGWTARADSQSVHGTDIYLSVSQDHGQTFGAPVKVNDDTKPAVHGMHSLALAKDGRIYVAWLDERDITPVAMKDKKMNASSGGHHMENNRDLFFSSSTDGGHTFTSNQRVATSVCPCCKTALAIGPEGRIYLSWRQVLPGDFRHIAVSSSADGKTFSKPAIVSDDQWVLKGCPVSGAALLAEAGGKLRVLWYAAGETGRHGIYWSESRDNGQTFSQRQLLAPTEAHGTPVLLNDDDGSAMGVWEGGESGTTHLLAARLPAGAPGKSDQHLAGNGVLPGAAASRDRLFIVELMKDGSKQSIWLLTALKAGV
jgi:hypothetical protein